MSSNAKQIPINIRAREAQRNLIDRAAAFENKTRSDFILEASCQHAEEVLLNARFFYLDPLHYSHFVAALDAPVAENENLRRLLSKQSPWE